MKSIILAIAIAILSIGNSHVVGEQNNEDTASNSVITQVVVQGEKEKENTMIPELLQNRGKLLSFRVAMTEGKRTTEQLQEMEQKLDDLIKTLLAKVEDPIPTDYFVVATFEDVKLYILLGVENPEKHILVKSQDGSWFTFEGDKKLVSDVLNQI